MGAWSHEPFGNDTACDWAAELVAASDWSVVDEALQGALESQEYLESDQGSAAHAALEVLAKALGRGTQQDAYTEDVDAWVARQGEPPAEVLAKAGPVIRALLSDQSELQELWSEVEDTTWQANVETLRRALGAS